MLLLTSAVVATIGPSSQSVDVLCKMLEAGMTCARLDLTVPHQHSALQLQNEDGLPCMSAAQQPATR